MTRLSWTIVCAGLILTLGCADDEPKVDETVKTEKVDKAKKAKKKAKKMAEKAEMKDEMADKDSPSEPTSQPAPAPMPSDGGETTTMDPAVGETTSRAECSLPGDARVVKVVKKSEGGCGVNYQKTDYHRQVAWAQNDLTFCDQKSEQVQGNLTAAGFQCGGSPSAADAPAPAPAPASAPASDATGTPGETQPATQP